MRGGMIALDGGLIWGDFCVHTAQYHMGLRLLSTSPARSS